MTWRALAVLLLLAFGLPSAAAAESQISGRVTDPQGRPVSAAQLRLIAPGGDQAAAVSDADGRFAFAALTAGTYRIQASAPGLGETARDLRLAEGESLAADLSFARVAGRTESLTVTADLAQPDIRHPDPAQRVNVREDILDANPGRPGAPVSIPGLPIESASGGLKAPQYFAPGVAGDHGEPIAQFFEVGSYLVPNNLSANAHGNGYADPNVIVPAIIESVVTDGGAFNVAEGNHSVNVAVAYGFRPRVDLFATLTGDYRDLDLAAGWNWIALQASYGNGFLDTLEHRQQYKVNLFHSFERGNHAVTLFGIVYYGQSRIPGLVPIGVSGLHDTIDPRQRDQTHTGEAVVNDVWRPSPSTELQFSGFFRTYNLALYSNFGDGLIRQSEFRTVGGGNATYVRRVNRFLSVLAGMDFLREAPRRLDLDHYDPFRKVTANNVTIGFLSPYVALDGRLTAWLHFNLGWRRDQIGFQNTDLLHAENSYRKWAGVNSPKATLSLLPPERMPLPAVAFSFGQAFFTNDPRIGAGAAEGTPVSRAHSYQMVVSKTALGTDFRLTLGRVTQEQSLSKIDPDTGLQFDEGPSRNRYISVAARRYFHWGMLQGSVAKADARDLSDGTPTPEAPRLIVDAVGTLDRLPWGLHARAEFEDVGRKPLGDGFTGVPVRELRGALMREFGPRLRAGVNFLIASGYTGQTTEGLALPGEGAPFERVTGMYLPSYATVSLSCRLGRLGRP